MPSRVRIKIESARNLPIMDYVHQSTDAYVELKISDIFEEKTDIVYKDLNPVWNKEFVAQIPHDGTLMKHPLEIKIWDRDTLSSDDVIGTIHIDLSNLMINDNNTISGWFPIFDTFRGARGELKVTVDLDFFGNKTVGIDSNGHVMFFSSTNIFNNVEIRDILGFVEELIVDVDPEYNWKDSFRTSRTSNEARQYVLYKIAGKLRREISNKVRDLGGNAVIGFYHHFDFEPEGFIVGRAYGTVVRLKKYIKRLDMSNSTSSLPSPDVLETFEYNEYDNSPFRKENEFFSSSLGTTTFENSYTNREFSISKLYANEVHLLTIHDLPRPFRIKIGGIVTARSIKLISKSTKNECRTLRDKWWSELREEIKSHARFMNCQYILGYQENTYVKNGVAVLSASGTAVKVSLPSIQRDTQSGVSSGSDLESSVINLSESYGMSKSINIPEINNRYYREYQRSGHTVSPYLIACHPCHIPYNSIDSPFPMKLTNCNLCKKGLVPEILLSTIAPPAGIQIIGQGEMIEAYVCRKKKKCQGESNAQQLSELIPFLEYDLHKQIVLKLRFLGMNACFSITTQIKEGDNIIMAIAHGTAVRLAALPKPQHLKMKNVESTHLRTKLNKLVKISQTNCEAIDELENYIYPSLHPSLDYLHTSKGSLSDSYEDEKVFPPFADNLDEDIQNLMDSSESMEAVDLHQSTTNSGTYGNGNSIVVELDEKIDDELMYSLLSHHHKDKTIPISNTQIIPGYSLSSVVNIGQISFIRVIDFEQQKIEMNQLLSKIFETMYEHIFFRLKPFMPCCLCGVNIDVEVPDDDDVQILFTATILGIQQPLELPSNKQESSKKKKRRKKPKDEDSLALRKLRSISTVEITTLNYIPGAHVDKFLGRISLNFIKESFSTREQGGKNTFAHNFLVEVQMIARSHVSALGGNALLSFRYEVCDLSGKSSKNQAYCMISLTGDAVHISYKEPSQIVTVDKSSQSK